MSGERLEALLRPCQRDGEAGDWWGAQHQHCTGTEHISRETQVWCTCPCHRVPAFGLFELLGGSIPRPGDQPAPVGGEGDVWAEIIASPVSRHVRDLCVARRQLGIERYGQPLRRGDGRDHRRDLREELLDAACYAWALGLQGLTEQLLGNVERLEAMPAEVRRGE